MKEKLFIPKKCKVGFNVRPDTYTGMLGYVIYNDGKVWRKEASWTGWVENHISQEEYNERKKTAWEQQVKNYTRCWEQSKESFEKNDNNSRHYKNTAEKTLEQYLKECRVDNLDTYQYYSGKSKVNEGLIPIEFDNVPTEGFVLNKKAGGYSSGWNHRQTYCRIYDPRGFEFEVSIPNLLFILEECNSNKGKGLEGEFVYSWEGKDLVLLPTSSPDFKSSSYFTNAQTKKVAAKDLKPGFIYETKQLKHLVFLGKFDWFEKKAVEVKKNPTDKDYYSWSKTRRIGYQTIKAKKNVFYDIENKGFLGLASLTNISIEKEVSNEYAELIEKYQKSIHFSQISSLVSKPKEVSFKDSYYDGNIIKEDGNYFAVNLSRTYKDNWDSKIVDGKLITNNTKIWKYELKYKKKISFENNALKLEDLSTIKEFTSTNSQDADVLEKENNEIKSKFEFIELFLKYENGYEEKCPTY